MGYVVEVVMFAVACVLVAVFEHADLGIAISIFHTIILVVIVYAVARLANFITSTISRRRTA